MCCSVAAWLQRTAALLALTCLSAAAAPAEPSIPAASADREAWLVTYGPGEIYWQRFGHNAIWLREPGRGLDHTFNFGYFDFRQERFLVRFIRGRMRYFSLAQPAAREFALYGAERRGISAQRLDLTRAEFQQLRDHLLNAVQPANRDYLYDYYRDNCSTRVRDALDAALGGALHARYAGAPAEQSFRDHTRRLTAADFWYYLGLEIGLGARVDGASSRWDEMFIPAVLAAAVEDFGRAGPGGFDPLVSGTHVILAAPGGGPSAAPRPVWHRYLLLGLALTVAAWVCGATVAPSVAHAAAIAWMVAAGLAGTVLLGLWFFTDHHAAGANANVLLFSPLFWIGLAPRLRRAGAAVLLLGTCSAAVLAMLPDAQYTLDALALALPLNLGCAAWLARRGPAPRQG